MGGGGAVIANRGYVKVCTVIAHNSIRVIIQHPITSNFADCDPKTPDWLSRVRRIAARCVRQGLF
jgi:hypothetical protein